MNKSVADAQKAAGAATGVVYTFSLLAAPVWGRLCDKLGRYVCIYIYIYMYVCMCVYVLAAGTWGRLCGTLHVCVCACTHICMYISHLCQHLAGSIHKNKSKYIHTYIHTYMHACIHRRSAHTSACRYVFLQLHISMRHAYKQTHKSKHMHTYIHTHIHACIHRRSAHTSACRYFFCSFIFIVFFSSKSVLGSWIRCRRYVCVCMYACMCV
jgi:nitrate/nitrite transporter NarK